MLTDPHRSFCGRSYHVVEALGHAVITGIDQVDFGALDGDGAAASDLLGHLQSSGHHGLLIPKHSAGGFQQGKVTG